jgi:hypothetical protein
LGTKIRQFSSEFINHVYCGNPILLVSQLKLLRSSIYVAQTAKFKVLRTICFVWVWNMDYLLSRNNVLHVFVNAVLRDINEQFIWNVT